MNIKRFLLMSTVSLSILSTSLVSAQSTANTALSPVSHSSQHHPEITKVLTPQQQVELVKIKKNLRAQMIPLIKEKQAISMQIRGKIATPNTKWSDLSGLVERGNQIDLKMSTLWTKTQLQTYQKLGILLPIHHRHHCSKPNQSK